MIKTKEEKIRILYVDDEENNLLAFEATFRQDYKIFLAISAQKGRALLKTQEVDIIIVDQRMPEEAGIDFLTSVLPLYPDPMRILLTVYTDIQVAIDAVNKNQIYHYLTKPWEGDYMRTVIKNAYRNLSLQKENKKLTDDLKKSNDQVEFLLRQNLLS